MKTIEQDIKKLHKLEQEGKKITWKVDGKVTEEFKQHSLKLVELKKDFQSKYGRQALVTFAMYSTLEKRLKYVPKGSPKHSPTRLQNSKGNGYGNM